MSLVKLYYRFVVRRRTAAAWTSLNEVLLEGEIGLETDTRRFKLGDGTTAWNSLAYSSAATLADTRRILDLLGSTAEGDIIYKGPSGWTRLAKGTDGHVLKLASGLPVWAAESGGGGGGSGAMELVGTATVSGSAVTTFGLSGLDLDTDTHWRVICKIKDALGSDINILLQYNADTTASNYRHQRVTFNGTGTAPQRSNDPFISSALANTSAFFTIDIARDPDGYVRANSNSNRSITSATGGALSQMFWHQWITTGANVTQLDIAAGTASGLGVGSTFSLYKIAP